MKWGVIIFWTLLIGTAAMRVALSLDQKAPLIGDCVKQSIEGTGTIADDPVRKSSGQIFIVHADTLDRTGSNDGCQADIYIRIDTKLYPQFSYGDRISFSGKLGEPFNFSGDNGRSFDYKGYLAKDDVYYEVKSANVDTNNLKSPRSLRESTTFTGGISDNPSSAYALRIITSIPSSISSWLYSIKRKFVLNLEQALGEPQAALAAGIVMGEKASLGQDLLNEFREVGLIHIVILSGFSVAIITSSLRRMFSFLPRVWGILLCGAFIVSFAVMVGAQATVVRACMMACTVLFADLVRRDYSTIRALFFVALLMLIQNPMILLHDSSFQLSFLATLGLIMLARPVQKFFWFIPDKFGMRDTISCTLATQIFVSPYILYMMGQLSFIGVFVNIITLPFLPLTMLVVFLTGASGFVSGTVSQFIGYAAHVLLTYILWLVDYFSHVPFASVNVGAFSGWWVVGFYVLFLGMYWGKKYWKTS